MLSAQQLTIDRLHGTDGYHSDVLIGRRNVEGGGRQDTFHNTGFRGVVGIRGAISENWDYDAERAVLEGEPRGSHAEPLRHGAQPARNRRRSRPGSGERHLQPAGLPLVPRRHGSELRAVQHLRSLPIHPAQAALAYLQAPTISSARIDQEIYTASVTGDLGGIGLQSPFAGESIALAVGVERRTDRVEFVPDLLLQTQAIGGQGGPVTPLNGSADVTDYFAELRVPLVQDAPFADQLSIDMAYRYSDYDDDTTDTYKIGMDWAPIEDVRFRGSFQRAVRAANVIELFTVQGFNLFDGAPDTDPCGPAQDCDAPAVPRYGRSRHLLRQHLCWSALPASTTSCRAVTPTSMPEESDTYTYGVILQPRFLPKLAMSIDYFDIEITDAVSTFGPHERAHRLLRKQRSGRLRQHRPRPGDWRLCGSAMATSGT